MLKLDLLPAHYAVARRNRRLIALSVPVLVVVAALLLGQSLLGAAYRHQVLGLIPHIAGALVVTGAVMMASMIESAKYGMSKVSTPAPVKSHAKIKNRSGPSAKAPPT